MSRNTKRIFAKIEHGFAGIINRSEREVAIADLTDDELEERGRGLTHKFLNSWRVRATQADVRLLLRGLDSYPDIMDRLTFQETLDLGIWPDMPIERLGRR